MPQMHPLMWIALFGFSLICFVMVITILFFSCAKPNTVFSLHPKLSTKTPTWKW